MTRINDLIRVVTLHATVVASGPLTYLMGCGVASCVNIRFATLETTLLYASDMSVARLQYDS